MGVILLDTKIAFWKSHRRIENNFRGYYFSHVTRELLRVTI